MPPEPPNPSLPVRLDLPNACLWRGTQPTPLRPKTFAVLQCLLAQPGQLVTKATLLDTVWPETAVSDVVLMVCIRELRQALGDDPKAPRFIQTVHRRGYRFIGDLPVTASPTRSLPFTARSLTPPVGREAELARLHALLAQALAGTRQVVFVTGEAGLGKTTLVETFIAQLDAHGPVWTGRGQCVEHYGAGEAYLPVLEALGRLGRGSGGKELVALLEQQAPIWLVQLPGLVRAADLEALQHRVSGATRDRMLRELAEAIDLLTAQQPLVLVLEDLHWSDPSTLDLLAVLARRPEPARLLVLGTYRPVEMLTREHPLRVVTRELQLHRYCEDLSLGFLSEADVMTYLTRRFAGGGTDQLSLRALARRIHRRTEGNPLFMVNVVHHLLAQGGIVQQDGGWEVTDDVTQLSAVVPANLEQFIVQQFDRCRPEEQQVLEVASVAGREFSTAAVTAGLDVVVEEVERWCDGLVRREHFLQERGTEEWPDGTVASRYGFIHALYQDVVYHRIPGGRRQRLHKQIGERIERAYGERAREIAAALAVHFERGRDDLRAVRYCGRAAWNALKRAANVEAFDHLRQGLALLATLADTPQRRLHELDLQLALGYVLVITKGFAVPEAGHAYARAYELCQQVERPSRLFATLQGLWVFHQARAEHQKARERGAQLLQLAQRTQRTPIVLAAHQALGQSLYFLGELAASRAHCEHGIRLYTPPLHLPQYNPGVICASYAALVLWYLGYPDQARQRGCDALALARTLSDPHSLAIGLWHAAVLQLFCRDVQAAQTHAEATIALAAEHSFPTWHMQGAVLWGWSLATQGHIKESMAEMHQGLATSQAMGIRVLVPMFLGLLAEACGHAGQATEGLRLLLDACRRVEETQERFYEAELYRLQGELTLKQFRVEHLESSVKTSQGQSKPVSHSKSGSMNSQSLTPDPHAKAEEYFQKAIEIARRQGAKSLELRAVMSLSRLWHQEGKREKARLMLADTYNWFTEGFDTKDLQEARALLDDLTVQTTALRKRHTVTEA